jgi:group I intron endonuclease
MKYTVYKITNLINEKIYIGVHRTNNLDDDYFSSSKLVKLAVKKYGIENFVKDILYVYDNPEEMFLKEKEIVNKEFVQRADTYNLTCGGYGSWEHWNNGSKKHRETARKAGKKAMKILQAFLLKNPEKKVMPPDWTGKRHTPDTIEKMSKSKKGKYAGSSNSQYNTVWCVEENAEDYTNRKKFKKDEVPAGWVTASTHKDNLKRKSGTYGRKWYNDGTTNFYLLPEDDRISKMNKGRIGQLFKKKQ